MKTAKNYSNRNVVYLLLLLATFTSCKTYNVYVASQKPVQACPVSFTKQPISKLSQADSIFRVASKEAMRKALE